MDKSESLEALQIQRKPQSEEQNDNFEEQDEEESVRVGGLNQSQSLVELSSSQVNQLSESQLEPLPVAPSAAVSPEDDQCLGGAYSEQFFFNLTRGKMNFSYFCNW